MSLSAHKLEPVDMETLKPQPRAQTGTAQIGAAMRTLECESPKVVPFKIEMLEQLELEPLNLRPLELDPL